MIMEREQTCQGGLIGLGVMGWNLAQQLGEKGVRLGIYNRTAQVLSLIHILREIVKESGIGMGYLSEVNKGIKLARYCLLYTSRCV